MKAQEHPLADVTVMCGQCAWYRASADREEVPSLCKRLDHKRIRFRRKVFLAYDCGFLSPHICREFKPGPSCPWLSSVWSGYDDYAPYISRGEVALEDSGFPGITFFVPQSDFADGKHLNPDGTIAWTRKQYYKGRKLITEFPDGTTVVGNCRQNPAKAEKKEGA